MSCLMHGANNPNVDADLQGIRLLIRQCVDILAKLETSYSVLTVFMLNDSPETISSVSPHSASDQNTVSSWHFSGAHTSDPVHSFVFTGSGKEYFRIWIVNLCLTIATCGIYSAWAKVRRLQYFDRNTQLGGAVFDFHGNPMPILKGRMVAVLLLAANHYAFGFSKVFGLAVVGFLLLGLPWMMRGALRFRLCNTSYRGLRFNFAGSLAGACLAYLPVVLLVMLPSLILGWDPTKGKWAGGASLLYLGWPFLHAGIRRYQHRHLEYGSARATYTGPTGDFFATYFIAGLVVVFAIFIAGIFTALVAVGAWAGKTWITFLPVAMMIFVAYVMYLLAGPYIQARIYNLAWSHTRFPHVTIRSELSAKAYIKLQTINTLLTLLTLGLYRPFAVVRAYEYRLAHMSVHVDGTFDELLGDQHRVEVGASGDSTAEFLGFDLSW